MCALRYDGDKCNDGFLRLMECLMACCRSTLPLLVTWTNQVSTNFVQFFSITLGYGNSVGNTEELQHLLHNPNALVAVSKGMQAVKLCTHKILQFLTGGAG